MTIESTNGRRKSCTCEPLPEWAREQKALLERISGKRIRLVNQHCPIHGAEL